jgi:hypothetical protein
MGGKDDGSRLAPSVLSVVPKEKANKHQTEQCWKNYMRGDEGIQSAGHDRLFAVGHDHDADPA